LRSCHQAAFIGIIPGFGRIGGCREKGCGDFGVWTMGEKKFDFWQDHSLRFLEMAFRTDRRERLERHDGYGKNMSGCGDTVEMFLMVEGGRIQSISFIASGCMNTNACANTVAQLAEGRSLEEAREITPGDVIGYLETLPEESAHCAELALGALYTALSRVKRKPPVDAGKTGEPL
jgi:nitrogen fixation NifU-like protein